MKSQISHPRFHVLCGLLLAVLAGSGLHAQDAPAAPPAPAKPRVIREIFVPFEDLSVLLEGQPRRVFLGRKEFDELRAKVKQAEDAKAPLSITWLSGNYDVTLEPERARISGKLEFEVLNEGWQEVPLAVAGVGIRSATLDGQPAALGQLGDGRTLLFVNGKGKHTLALELVAPLVTTAAQQQLSITLPVEGAAKMNLSVPGNVEIRSGGQVLSRTVDEAMNVTRFELVPTRGPLSLTMSLNNKRIAAQRFVLASSVLLDEITASYEVLHATVTMAVLQGAADTFRFELPAGFEVTEVRSDRIDQWTIDNAQMPVILTVKLREPASDKVTMQITALRPGERFAAWTFPRLVPLEVGGSVALVGVLAEERLKVEDIKPSDNLVPLDHQQLEAVAPKSVTSPAPGLPRSNAIAAFFAPRPVFDISAKFSLPPPELAVQSQFIWTIGDRKQEVIGTLTLAPTVDKLVLVDLFAPQGWEVGDVERIVKPDANAPLPALPGPGPQAPNPALTVDRFAATRDGKPVTRLRIRLPEAVLPGQTVQLGFVASRTPPGWLGNWTTMKTEMPIFSVATASKEAGFIAVAATDDLDPRPTKTTGLLPLMRDEIAQLHSAGKIASLAYRYEAPPYALELTVERPAPVVTARIFNFFELRPGELIAHYELIYEVQQARTQKVSFRLPPGSPTDVRIVGMAGGDDPKNPEPAVKVQETVSELKPEGRVWTVSLAERRGGKIRLGVDFRQAVATAGGSVSLPLIVAEDVSYQSSLAAIEGHPDLEITPPAKLTPVDIGELADAQYQPGRRLIGVYSFLGAAPALSVRAGTRAGYALATTLVEQAQLVTRVAGGQASITSAEFRLKTKAALIEAVLPAGAKLWTVLVDGQPTRPQLDAKKTLLIELPPTTAAQSHTLRIVYELPGNGLGFWGNIDVAAPALYERAERGLAAQEIPLADVAWQLVLPSGYRVVRSQGSVDGLQVQRSQPIVKLAGALYGLSGGARGYGPFHRNATDLSGGVTVSSPYYLSDDVQYYSPKTAESHSYRTRGPRDFLAGAPEPLAESKPNEEMPQTADGDQAAAKMPTMGSRVTVGLNSPGPGVGGPGPAMPQPVAPPTIVGSAGVNAVDAPPAPAADPFGAQPPPGNPPPSPTTPQPAKKPATLQGVRSLPMEVQPLAGEQVLVLRGLGTEPTLALTLADDFRFRLFGWGLAAVIVIAGVWLTRSSLAARLRLIAAALLISTLVPLVTGYFQEWDPVFEAVFFAGAIVGFWYLLVALYDWLVEIFVNPPIPAAPPAPPASPPPAPVVETPPGTSPAPVIISAFLLALLLGLASSAEAQDLSMVKDPVADVPVPELAPAVELGPPPKIPEDALLIPYDGTAEDGVAKADRVMVPYAEYIRLWNLAFPDAPKETPPPGRGYALAGASYKATLAEGDEIELTGQLAVDLFTDKPTDIPLPLAGAVLSRIAVDGQPAKIRWAAAEAAGHPGPPPQAQEPEGKGGVIRQMPLLLVTLTGKGRKKIDLIIRAKLQRQGGWRIIDAQLPHAPATSLALTLAKSGTEVRLTDTADKGTFTAPADNATFDTVLAPGGRLHMQWRGQVTEAMVDRSLSVTAAGVFDVREDGLKLVWDLNLEFPRAQRDSFTLQLPAGYDLERVAGVNVRGWEKKEGNLLDVTLLKAVRDAEKITVFLARRPEDVWKEYAAFNVPAVSVQGAVIQRGIITIRRSPLISVRVTNMTAMSRADVPDEAARLFDESDFTDKHVGVRPYQAYRFDALPFTLSLAALRITDRPTAELHTLLRLTRREARFETNIIITPQDRPLYVFRIRVPDGVEIEQVRLPGGAFATANDWYLATEEGKRVLVLRLPSGVRSQAAWSVTGVYQKAMGAEDLKQVPIPSLELLDAERQEGDIAIITDPGLDVTPANLKGLEPIALARTKEWVTDANMPFNRVALRYTQAGYSGVLNLTLRKARVSALSISNIRVTDRVIEETLFLEFMVREAGIREVTFEAPARFRTARVNSPALRQKTIEDAAGGWVRFRLEFQTEVMDQLVVVLNHDRLFAPEQKEEAPIPRAMTGEIDRQFVSLVNDTHAELTVVPADTKQVEALDARSEQWARLRQILPTRIDLAYAVEAGADAPRLVYTTTRRKVVETVAARIGLAQATLVVDGAGSYRGEQIYKVSNRTEQFLVIELPVGARLWTAVVDGEPVKPAPDAASPPSDRIVRIPLVKSAEGELDYEVRLKYGNEPGQRLNLSSLASITFPLIKPKNISAEANSVRLFLPEEYSWFHFGGTARTATDLGDLRAESENYVNRQIAALVETAQKGDMLSKARATSNLKSLKQSIVVDQSQSQSIEGEYAANANLFNARKEQEQALQQVDRELQKFDQSLNESKATAKDNRDQLNDLATGQTNGRAFNLANSNPTNFQFGVYQGPEEQSIRRPPGKEGQQPGGQKPGDSQPAGNQPGQPPSRVNFGNRVGGIEGIANQPQQGQGQGQGGFGQQAFGPQPQEFSEFEGRNKARIEEIVKQQSATKGQKDVLRSETELENAKRYSERYSKGEGNRGGKGGGLAFSQQSLDTAQPQQGGFDAPQTPRGGYNLPPANPVAVTGVHGGSGGGFGGGERVARVRGVEYETNTPGGGPGRASGLGGEYASLEIELPKRGREFLFTAPRGDVEITAQPFHQELIERGGRFALLAIVALVVLGIVWGASRVLPHIGLTFLAIPLVVLGLLGVGLNIFPFAAFFALALGIVIAIAAIRAARMTPVAPPAAPATRA